MTNAEEMKKLFGHLEKMLKSVKVTPNDLKTATMAGASMARNNAIEKVPRKTSTLARSISPKAVPEGPPEADKANILQVSLSQMSCTVTIGTKLPYARRIEFGFMDVDAAGRMYNQLPSPFLGPAVNDHKDELKYEMGDALAELLEKRWKEAAEK